MFTKLDSQSLCIYLKLLSMKGIEKSIFFQVIHGGVYGLLRGLLVSISESGWKMVVQVFRSKMIHGYLYILESGVISTESANSV